MELNCLEYVLTNHINARHQSCRSMELYRIEVRDVFEGTNVLLTGLQAKQFLAELNAKIGENPMSAQAERQQLLQEVSTTSLAPTQSRKREYADPAAVTKRMAKLKLDDKARNNTCRQCDRAYPATAEGNKK